MAFTSNRDGTVQIYVMHADGSLQQKITNTAGFNTEPSWSPDGSRVAFSSDRDGNFEIYLAQIKAK